MQLSANIVEIGELVAWPGPNGYLLDSVPSLSQLSPGVAE
jgi:hypothetical protein